MILRCLPFNVSRSTTVDCRWEDQARTPCPPGTYGHCVPERHEVASTALDRFLTV